jgi:hypothetical protein
VNIGFTDAGRHTVGEGDGHGRIAVRRRHVQFERRTGTGQCRRPPDHDRRRGERERSALPAADVDAGAADSAIRDSARTVNGSPTACGNTGRAPTYFDVRSTHVAGTIWRYASAAAAATDHPGRPAHRIRRAGRRVGLHGVRVHRENSGCRGSSGDDHDALSRGAGTADAHSIAGAGGVGVRARRRCWNRP